MGKYDKALKELQNGLAYLKEEIQTKRRLLIFPKKDEKIQELQSGITYLHGYVLFQKEYTLTLVNQE